MAILKIAKMGHPVLRQRASEVAEPTSAEIARLVEDMVETMRDAPGTGLAAPQVHVPLRVVVFQVLPERAAREAGADGEVPLTVLINPVIEPVGTELAEDWEGCLSVPGLRGVVPRYLKIRYSGQTLDGSTLTREAEGFHARVVQHECDHLDGILYPQRMTDLGKLMFDSELRHYLAPRQPAPAEEAEPA